MLSTCHFSKLPLKFRQWLTLCCSCLSSPRWFHFSHSTVSQGKPVHFLLNRTYKIWKNFWSTWKRNICHGLFDNGEIMHQVYDKSERQKYHVIMSFSPFFRFPLSCLPFSMRRVMFSCLSTTRVFNSSFWIVLLQLSACDGSFIFLHFLAVKRMTRAQFPPHESFTLAAKLNIISGNLSFLLWACVQNEVNGIHKFYRYILVATCRKVISS